MKTERAIGSAVSGPQPVPAPAAMRAVVAVAPGGPETLRPDTVPVPARVGSEVLVRVVAAGVNTIDGRTRSGAGVAAGLAGWPMIPGYDFSGVVVESPYASFPLQPGDEVFGMSAFPRAGGTYAEYVSVPALNLARKPSVLSHVEAAAVPLAALTAWGATVELAKAHEGQRVLVHAGNGGVGHLAVQIAAYFGSAVTATSSTRNAEWLRSLGATEVIDATSTRFEEVLSDFDVVLDGVGDAQDRTASRSLDVLRPGGLLVTLPGSASRHVLAEAADRGIRASGFWVTPDAKSLEIVSRLITSGTVRVTVDRVLDLAEAAEAHRLLDDGAVRGKIVLKVSDY